MYLTVQKQHLQMLIVAKFVVKMSDLILVKKEPQAGDNTHLWWPRPLSFSGLLLLWAWY